jgi:hypothetical protein
MKKAKKTVKRASKSETVTLYYTASLGRVSGREIKAKKRMDILVQKYIAEGITERAGQDRALKEMRDNPRGDWRAG